jgi:hypothetical protein
METFSLIPEHIQRSLDKAAEFPGKSGQIASGVGWRDVLTPRRVLSADGVQVLNSSAEAIMCPDYSFAADALEAGDTFKYTLMGDISTVITTPGTITFRLRWGGVAGTVLCASGALAPDPTAASTTVSYVLEYYVVCRATGAAGSAFAMGKLLMTDVDDASATTLKGNLDMFAIPASAPAAVAINTTTANNALSPTVQFSVATATTQLTNHTAILESLN